MSDIGWRADGIARAVAAGGVELERYLRPGFVSGIGVRRSTSGGAGSSGVAIESPGFYDPEPDEYDSAKQRLAP